MCSFFFCFCKLPVKQNNINLQFPGHHLQADSDGEFITNSWVFLSYVAVVSRPRMKVP